MVHKHDVYNADDDVDVTERLQRGTQLSFLKNLSSFNEKGYVFWEAPYIYCVTPSSET